MKKYTTSERLKQIMSSRGLKQIDILNMCIPYGKKHNIRIGKTDLSQYVSGKVVPGQEKLSILSMALGVSEVWLMGYEQNAFDGQNHENIYPLPEFKKLPLVGEIACGEPILAQQNIEDYINCPENVDATFCLRCKGDSMIGARILDGDIVYIHQQPTIENGEIAAVLIDNEATLKRVYRQADKVILQPENPAYPPLVFVREEINQISILGKAVCFLSSIK